MFSRIQQYLQNPMQLLYTIPAILIGLTVHEWAHAYAADKLGDPTAKNLGRMTLNPLAHLDPLGIIMLLFLGFGWARPVPVNPRNFKKFRRDDIIVSLAGITANCIVAFFAVLIFYAGILFWGLGNNDAYYQIMMRIITINLSLMVFNLIPLHPLDGSHVAESLLFRKMPRVFLFLRDYGQYILIALLITGVLSNILTFLVGGIFDILSRLALLILNLFS